MPTEPPPGRGPVGEEELDVRPHVRQDGARAAAIRGAPLLQVKAQESEVAFGWDLCRADDTLDPNQASF